MVHTPLHNPIKANLHDKNLKNLGKKSSKRENQLYEPQGRDSKPRFAAETAGNLLTEIKEKITKIPWIW